MPNCGKFKAESCIAYSRPEFQKLKEDCYWATDINRNDVWAIFPGILTNDIGKFHELLIRFA